MQLPEFLLIRRNQYIVGGIIFVLLFGLVLALTNRGPAKQLAVVSEPVTLTWWKPFYGSDVYSEVINDFKKLPGNEQITINIVKKEYNGEYYKNLIGDIARKAGPDIFTLRNDDLPAYKEYMTPISTISNASLAKYKQDFTDLAVRDTIDRDKVYAITTYIENLQLYYNKTILDQNSIPLPPKTWSELDLQLSKLNKRNVNSLNFDQSAISLGTGGRGLDGEPNINRLEDIIPMLLFQNGGQMYDYQSNQPVFGRNKNEKDVALGISTASSFKLDDKTKETNPTYRSLKFYTDFASDGQSRYSWNTTSNNNIDAFVNGKLAYMLHYSYEADEIKQRNDRIQFDVAPLPQLDNGVKKTYGFFFMDGMNRELEFDVKQKNKKTAAERFLTYLATKDAQIKFVAKTRLPGSRKDVIAEQVNSDDRIRIFAEGALYADNYYKPDVIATEKLWVDLVERVQYKNQPLSDSITQAVREYNALVQQGQKTR
jgi:ABC-type glycerol-3-phosphate transport system substrate-binding protein